MRAKCPMAVHLASALAALIAVQSSATMIAQDVKGLQSRPEARLQTRPEARLSAEQVVSQLRELRGDTRPAGARTSRGKCALALTFQILDNWSRFSEAEQTLIRSLLAQPSTQSDRIIGHFHIYYDTTGPNSPALLDSHRQRIPGSAEAYVDSAGRILNHVWSFEIDGLGYSHPPLQADSTYHVTIQDLPSGLYGETIPDPTPIAPGPPPRYSTSIEIDNDFREAAYFTSGISALEVTAAHEFHHSVQLGSYGYWGDQERYIYEITSTWMEDVVYNDVNDYYQYLSNNVYQTSQFSTPDIRFTKLDQSIEYSRSIWGKFIEKRFSRAVMLRTWEWMRQYPSLEATDRALTEAGSSFRAAYLEYSFWNLNTGPAADTTRYYPEGRNYPAMRIASTSDYLPPEAAFQDSIQALSSTYDKICVLSSPADSCVNGKSMYVIVSNLDVPDGYSDQLFPFTYTLSANGSQGAKQLKNGLYAAIDVSDPQFWNTQETVPSVISDILVYPDPYKTGAGGVLWFRFPVFPRNTTARLSIFSSSMILMYSGDLPVIARRPQEASISWNGRSDNGETVPTGIYFFSISVDDQEYMGKFSAIRN